MAFETPSLETLAEQARGDISTRLFGNSDTVKKKSSLGFLAYMAGGLARGCYWFITWVARNVIPDTAGGEWLERWAAIWLGSNPRLPGYAATGVGTFTGTSVLVSSGEYLRNAAGLRFQTIESGTADADGEDIAITAVDVGEQYNLAEGDELTLEESISGVESTVVVGSGGLTGGVDRESNSALLTRLLLEIQEPPQGGNEADYKRWALAAHSSITRVFPQNNAGGLGVVTVRVVADDGAGGITASAGVLTAVEDYTEARRPWGLEQVNYLTPTEHSTDFTISIYPNTTAVQDAIEASVLAMYLRRARPEEGGGEGKIRLDWINEAISTAVGEDAHELTSPVANIEPSTGHMAVPGNFTFNTLSL